MVANSQLNGSQAGDPMKQVICECGRIAEVRRRSNGKRLRYKVCKCGTSLGGIESAAKLEREERDDIGVYGEFYEKTEAAAPPAKEWVPDETCLPEALEVEQEKSEVIASPSVGTGAKVFGIGCLVLGTAAGVFLGYDSLKNRSVSQ